MFTISQKIYDLFTQLHNHPELSGQEFYTQNLLIEFIQTNTDFEIHKLPGGFYCIYRYDSQQSFIAFRADYDAVSSDGTAKHLCGHDGHSASLCAVALKVYQTRPSRNIIFLFQSAEETGKGGELCCQIFKQENISEIYGVHNLPGHPLGKILTRYGTFAMGSMGIEIRFSGKPSHAAYPENGISPANAVGSFLSSVSDISTDSGFQGFCMCTVIGVHMGEKAFGVAPSDARIWLTIRSEIQSDLIELQKKIEKLALYLCTKNQLSFSIEYFDKFPATENHSHCVDKILRSCQGTLLPSPMRWSEDFGHYLFHCPGAFFGIGAGIDCPALHTESYHYPLELISITAEIFWKLLL